MKENKELTEELDKKQAISILAQSEGGKILLETLKKQAESLIDKLIRDYGVISHIELIAVIAELEAKRDLIKTIDKAESQVKILKQELNDKSN